MNKDSLMSRAACCLEDDSEEVRFQAVKVLSRAEFLGAIPLLMEVVGDKSYRVREAALQSICSFPTEVIFPRFETCIRNNDNATLRNAALEAFPRYGKKATHYLIKLAKDADEEVRMFSTALLGEIKDPEAVETLIEGLKDPDENVRHAAAESLGRLGDPRGVVPLIDCLSEGFWIQYPAVIALGNIGDPSAVRHLFPLVSDEMLGQAAIEALGRIGDTSAIPALVEILSKNDPTIRNHTIAALVRIKARVKKGDEAFPAESFSRVRDTLNNDELINHLLQSLDDPDLETRKNSVIALGWLKEKKAVRNLVGLLRDFNLEEYVISSLASIGENAMTELIETLKDPDHRIRISIIRSLDWIGKPEGILACLPCLLDENEEVRYQAVLAMAAVLDREEVEDALLKLISDQDPEFRATTVEVLGKSQSPYLVQKLINEISCGKPEKKVAIVQILGKLLDPRAFLPLQNILNDSNDEVRAEVYKALSRICPEKFSVEILIAGLADGSPTVRKAATQCLATCEGKNAESCLLLYLEDPDPEICLTVVETLGKIGSAASITPLIKTFERGGKNIKIATIQAIGKIRNKNSITFLIELLRETDPDLKRTALESLGELGDQRVVPNLIMALDDANWSVRSGAIIALGKIGDRRCISRLIEKVSDPEDLIKKEAIMVLGELKAREAVNEILPLIHNENLQFEVIHALEKMGIPDFLYFSTFITRCNSRLKCILVDLLGRLRKTDSVDLLLQILQDDFYTVRIRAAKSLGEIGNRKAIPHLLKAQKDDPCIEVRKEATSALKILDMQK